MRLQYVLQIKNIEDLRAKVAHKEEIREAPLTDGFRSAADEKLISFCYMIAGENTFDDAWSRECRGIVFNSVGRVCGRPLHKFFNVNEREETQVGNIDWSQVVRVMEKRDGSMIHTVKVRKLSHPGTEPVYDIKLKSKKSFESVVAQAAMNWVMDEAWRHALKFPPHALMRQKTVRGLLQKMIELDATAIFEWTAPDARIVLLYTEPELKLLHIRDNEDGNYWSVSAMKELADEFNVKMVEETDEFFLPFTREFDIQKMLDAAQTRENIEGWVIQFRDGNMVKLKTQWYMKRHKAMTFLRERDIAELVLAEQLDDLKALLVGDGVKIDEILDIERRVLEDIRGLERTAKSIAPPEDYKLLDRKTFVLKYKPISGEYFGFLMTMYSGKVPDYRNYFEKNLLKEKYGLKQLVLIPSVAEAE